MYIFCGENLKDGSGWEKVWEEKQKDCVRVDIRWIWQLSNWRKDLWRYKIDANELNDAKWEKMGNIRPWDILADMSRKSSRGGKKLYEYDSERGLRKS